MQELVRLSNCHHIVMAVIMVINQSSDSRKSESIHMHSFWLCKHGTVFGRVLVSPTQKTHARWCHVVLVKLLASMQTNAWKIFTAQRTYMISYSPIV